MDISKYYYYDINVFHQTYFQRHKKNPYLLPTHHKTNILNNQHNIYKVIQEWHISIITNPFLSKVIRTKKSTHKHTLKNYN